MNILIVCRGNTCRSPMFATLLEKRIQELDLKHKIESAGITSEAAGKPAAPEWTELLNQTGVDLSAHRSRFAGDLDLDGFDIIITLDEKAISFLIEKGVSVSKMWHVPITNPYQMGVTAYIRCFWDTEKRVERVILQIKEESSKIRS